MNGAANRAGREPRAPGGSGRDRAGSAHRPGVNPCSRAPRTRAGGALAALALAAAVTATVPGVAGAQTRATVTVEATLPTTQLEGGPLWFEVERSGAPTDAALDVAVQVSETGAMLPAAAKGVRTVTIPEFGEVGHLVIDSIADLTDEADSTVSVFVLERSGYRVGSPARARATVTDDDIPVVNVEAVAGSVREGSPAVFRVTRVGLTAQALTVELDVFDRNGALTGPALATGSATIGAGSSAAEISLATRDDNVDGPRGEAWVRVLAGDGYTTGVGAEAMVRVEDDELPAVSVEAVQDPVNEGTPAQFTVTRTGVLDDELEVRLAVSETGDMVDAALPGSVVIPAGQNSAGVEIPTVDDSTDESNGSVRVSLVSSTAYRLGTARSASVGIDDDETPTVGIVAVGATVTEGAAAHFRLTRAGHTADTLTVPLSVFEEGDVLTDAARQTSSVVFASGRASAALRLATDDDALEERDGRVTVYLDPGGTHGLSLTAQNASVAVGDNDRTGFSIEAESDAITEGGTAEFRVIRDGLGESAVTVRVSVSKQGDMFADSATETVDVAFAADVFEARFSIETMNDEADEIDGAVNATLLSGTLYSLRAARSARVAVRDDDLVNITVAGPASPVSEGSTAVFTFTRDGFLDREQAIRVFHYSSGKWTAAETGTTTVRFSRGSSTARLSLPIYDDEIDNDTDVTVGVDVLRTYEHELASFRLPGRGGATVTVTDNDTDDNLPVVSASASGSVVEGRDAVFTLRRTGITGHPLLVAVHVTETGAMLDGSPPREAMIARGSSTAAVRVRTRADGVAEESSSVTLRVVQAFADYTTNAASESASLTVLDNTGYVEPTVTIARLGSATVEEGTDLRFRVSRTGTTIGRISVNLGIGETGSTLRGHRPRSVTLDPDATGATVTLSTDNDDRVEQPSVVTVTLRSGDRYTVGSPASATVTVNDDDTAGSSLSLSRSVSPDGPGTAFAASAGPALSVADSAVDEAPGATLDFVVTLSPAAARTVTVEYRTGNGTADAGTDYRRTAGTLGFGPGETRKTVSVPVLDDPLHEGSETMTLSLSNPSGAAIGDGEATGTIRNTDVMPGAWIARFGRAVAEQAIGAVEARLASPRAPGLAGSVAGRALAGVAAGAAAGGDGFAPLAFGSRTATDRELLAGSSFALAGGSAERGSAAFWGGGAATRFDGRAGGRGLDGEVAGATLGVDYAQDLVLAGLMVSHARGEGDYRAGAGGAVSSSLTSVFPYARYALGDRVALWGMAGYGAGKLTLKPQGGAKLHPDTDLMMGAAGLRGVLLDGAGDGPTLAAKSDAFALRMRADAAAGLAASEAQVTRLRLALEGAQAFGLGAGVVLTPRLELGLRHDGGDAETGTGADIGAGLDFADRARGLSAGMRARGLLTHEAGGFRDRGLAATLAYDPAPGSERGLSLGLAQSVGGPASGGADALFARPAPAHDGGDGFARRRFEARLGYGLGASGGRWTAVPELRLGLSQADREARLGLRLRAAAGFEMRLEAARREPADGDTPPESRIALTAAARW